MAEAAEVPTAQGVPVRAGVEWPALTPDDLVVVPGWRSHGFRIGGALSPGLAATGSPPTTGPAARSRSVCAGADALGRAGLLDGRRCTTHHDLQDELARRYPRATVVRDVLCTSSTAGS